MSRLDSASAKRGVLVQKPKTNVYTAMLIIAFLAMLAGCLFLFLQIQKYGGFGAA